MKKGRKGSCCGYLMKKEVKGSMNRNKEGENKNLEELRTKTSVQEQGLLLANQHLVVLGSGG